MRFTNLVPALIGAVAASAEPVNDDSTQDLETIVPGSYIVEFEGSQSSRDFLSELRDADIDAEPRMELSFKLFQGASFTVTNTKEDVDDSIITAKIAQNRRVKNVWPVRPIRIPDDLLVSVGHSNINEIGKKPVLKARDTEGNSTYGPHVMTQIDKLHEAGYTGKRLRIGIVDSGVDYTHPDLGGCFGPGCLVSYGYDLIGTNNGGDYVPDDDPIDTCFGHGTHVAGIIAARPNALGFSGVAPDVELGAYRAMDCLGGSTNDVMIAAFNRAYEDGSDIITASIGIDGGWPSDPWSIAIERIVEAGVPVIIAAGNSGELGLFAPSNPASAKGAGSIASVNAPETPLLMIAASYELDGAEAEFGWIAGAPKFGNASYPLYWVGQDSSGNSTADACSALSEEVPDLSGYVVLVPNGVVGCQAYTQALNLLEKGGDKLLFYHSNNAPGRLGFLPPGVTGSGLITLDQGKAFIEQIRDNNNITVTFTSPEMSPPYLELTPDVLAGGMASFFTSWGPNWDLSINPSFGAPGSQILSTFPVALGSYAIQRGTSMACPFAAATVALLAQAKDTLDPHTLTSILTSSSQQLPWFDDNKIDTQRRLAPVPQVGSGLIQGWDALQVKGILSVRGISFNDSDNHLPEASFTLKNMGKTDATYEIGHSPALTFFAFNEGSKAIGAFPNAIADGAAAKLEFKETSLLVPAGESVTIEVQCEPPIGVNPGLLPVYSGYITLNGTNGDNLALPYQGVAASMVKDTKPINLDNIVGTSLARNGDRPAFPISVDTVFTFTKLKNVSDLANIGNEPWPIARAVINLGTASSRIDLIPLNDTAVDLPRKKWLGYDSLGPIHTSNVDLQPRGSLRTIFYGMLDDLTIVPDGYYQLLVSVLRILGDPRKDEHWDSVELVPFYVEYKA